MLQLYETFEYRGGADNRESACVAVIGKAGCRTGQASIMSKLSWEHGDAVSGEFFKVACLRYSNPRANVTCRQTPARRRSILQRLGINLLPPTSQFSELLQAHMQYAHDSREVEGR
jgi:hypothetical protein